MRMGMRRREMGFVKWEMLRLRECIREVALHGQGHIPVSPFAVPHLVLPPRLHQVSSTSLYLSPLPSPKQAQNQFRKQLERGSEYCHAENQFQYQYSSKGTLRK